MSFSKPKKPKKPKLAAVETPPDRMVVEDRTRVTEQARERRRQGTAAATLTGERGLAGQPIMTATKRLLGG